MPQPLIKSQINVKCSETEAAHFEAASLFARKLKSFKLSYYSVSTLQRQWQLIYFAIFCLIINILKFIFMSHNNNIRDMNAGLKNLIRSYIMSSSISHLISMEQMRTSEIIT
jgi:hypothetical protein